MSKSSAKKATPPSGNKFMDLQSKMDQIDESIEDIEDDAPKSKKPKRDLHNLSSDSDNLAPSDHAPSDSNSMF